MRSDRAYLLYKLVPSKRAGKMDKIPLSPYTLDACAANDPANFADYDTCAAMVAAGMAHGVAWSVQPGYYFLDVDGSLYAPPEHDMTGAHYEVSSSGKGCHFIGRYTGERPAHRCKVSIAGADLELYTADRFVALTAEPPHSLPDTTPALGNMVATTFAPRAQLSATEWTYEPVPEWNGPEDDDELIERMLNRRESAASAFGGRATLRDLWECNVDALAASFPDNTGERPYDGSSVDQALSNHLAFWTGNNCERMWQLIQRSGLMRDKWHRDDYRESTILKAVGACAVVYGQKADKAPTPQTIPALAVPVAPMPPSAPTATAEVQKPTLRDGFQFVNVDGQLLLFKGCCYVTDEHKVLTPTGKMLKPEQFKANFGGYTFALDATNTKVTTDAWLAFTQSQAVTFPRADTSVFKPDIPAGAIVTEEGLRMVNTYVPVEVPRKQGDPTPFLIHLAKLLPNEHDRDILLAYMAAVVQFPGVKIQWAPLIQGVQGNGKTLLTRVVARAVGRRYVHMPRADEIGNKFNEWLVGKILCGVEEIYVPGHKVEVMEVLKPMITAGDGIGIEGKGKDQVTRDICCNFMFTSNHKDAVKLEEGDRRFAIFYTAQQELVHLRRDGMDCEYMPVLYEWLNRGGYAIVTDFLHTYPIPDALNPTTTLHRAPRTSSTAEAVEMSRGMVEQEIMEAVAEGRPGFCGGWISSVALDRLLDQLRASRVVPRSKRKDLLQGLGYMLHPALTDGRMTSASTVDGGAKPRLYIQHGHLHAQLSTPAQVAASYQNAQQVGGPSAAFGMVQ